MYCKIRRVIDIIIKYKNKIKLQQINNIPLVISICIVNYVIYNASLTISLLNEELNSYFNKLEKIIPDNS